jgi:hypothetical protein
MKSICELALLLLVLAPWGCASAEYRARPHTNDGPMFHLYHNGVEVVPDKP